MRTRAALLLSLLLLLGSAASPAPVQLALGVQLLVDDLLLAGRVNATFVQGEVGKARSKRPSG
jgi:hypothetical protein